MMKNDIIKDTISKITEEVIDIQHEMEELEKRKERIRQKRILAGRGTNNNIMIY